MLKSGIGMRTTKSGFTLIEILVVLVILGITASVALLAFGDFGESRRAQAEAQRFIHKVRLIRHQAILEAITYGMKITPSSYQIFRFSPPNIWTPVTSTLLKPYQFPKKITLYLNINPTNPTSSASNKNWVVFQASGEITPFRINFGLNKHPNIAHVVADDNGTTYLKLGPDL